MSKNDSIDSSHQNRAAGSSEAEFNIDAYRTVGKRDIAHFKTMAIKSPRNRYRLCLHSDHSHLTQEMIVCLKGFSYFHPHLHPANRSESYHMIEGMLDVYLLDETGALIDTIKLGAPNTIGTESRSFMYRLSKPIYHLTIPRSEWTVYHEILTGPFNKDTTVHYASFAPSEDETEATQRFVKKVTGFTIEELIQS